MFLASGETLTSYGSNAEVWILLMTLCFVNIEDSEKSVVDICVTVLLILYMSSCVIKFTF